MPNYIPIFNKHIQKYYPEQAREIQHEIVSHFSEIKPDIRVY